MSRSVCETKKLKELNFHFFSHSILVAIMTHFFLFLVTNIIRFFLLLVAIENEYFFLSFVMIV